MADHTIDQFVAAFGLVKKGREFVGPCPICKEGEDRFHVKEGTDGKPIFGCRYCIDGGEDNSGERAKAVFALLDGKPVVVPALAPTNAPMQATEPPKPRKLPNGKNDTRYDYVDAEGNLVFVVIRHDSANGKTIQPMDTCGGKGWILYRKRTFGTSTTVLIAKGYFGRR